MVEEKLKILVLGAGAIGTYIGGSLAAHNNTVWFFDRPESVERIQENGIKIILPDKQTYFIDKPNINADLEKILSLNIFDFAIISVKSYDSKNLIDQLRFINSPLPPLICFQNGVENELLFKENLNRSQVLSGTVTTAIGKTPNNEIVVEKLRGIGLEDIGELSQKIANAMNDAGLRVQLYENANNMKWSKLLTNLTSNALSAILGMSPSETLSNLDLYRLEIAQLRETLSVMESYKIRVVDLPGTPVKLFAWIVKYFPPRISQKILLGSIAKGRGAKMPSFYLDLESGRGKSEVEYLNGAVVKFGKKRNIKTPVNEFYTKTLMEITEGKIQRTHFLLQPEKFLDQIVI